MDQMIEQLCIQMEKSNIKFDELNELFEYNKIKKENINIKQIFESEERYQRYMNHNSYFQLNSNIRNKIKIFLKIPTNKYTIDIKYQWMKKIDFYLMDCIPENF